MWSQTFVGFLAIWLIWAAIPGEAHGACPYSEDHSHAEHEDGLDHDHGHLHSDHSHPHSHFSHAHLHEHGSHGSSHDPEHTHDGKCSEDHSHDNLHSHGSETSHRLKLPEELAEEEELALYGFGFNHLEEQHYADHHALSSAGLWLRAMGSSLLVSMASLICLMLLPFILSHGKPSQHVVDALAAFGAGAMLGDAFLHQLPHAFGSGGHASHFHMHDHIHSNPHVHETSHAAHAHSHSFEDLSVGLAVLFGILAFFIVEKIVRKAEELSTSHLGGHKHHHHHHQRNARDSNMNGSDQKEKTDDSISKRDENTKPTDDSDDKTNTTVPEKVVDPDEGLRRKKGGKKEDESSLKSNPGALKNANSGMNSNEDGSSNLVLGYLNLFSDGVHNFTDGMALGTAFLHHGTIGGWSRTLFLLAHELPQEVGDFGILVRSGFGVFKALAFNFLSALVALAGTAMALLVGGNPGHSSLIEGFTAGGFIYIAVAGVLPEMHQQANSLKQSLSQLASLGLGVGVAILISLAE